jgi:hypothetical protein
MDATLAEHEQVVLAAERDAAHWGAELARLGDAEEDAVVRAAENEGGDWGTTFQGTLLGVQRPGMHACAPLPPPTPPRPRPLQTVGSSRACGLGWRAVWSGAGEDNAIAKL